MMMLVSDVFVLLPLFALGLMIGGAIALVVFAPGAHDLEIGAAR